MGNNPSTTSALEIRFEDLRKQFRTARDEEVLDIWLIRDLRKKLATLSLDLQQAIDDRKVKATDHSIEELLESIKNLDQILGDFQEKFQFDDQEKRRLQREEAIAFKEREKLEYDHESMLKDLNRERDRRFNVVYHTDNALARASERDEEELKKKLAQAKTDLREIEEKIQYLKSSEGKEHWIADHKIHLGKLRQEQEELEEERRRDAPEVPVKLLDLGTEDHLGQLQNALVILLEAGNSAGGYVAPDLDDLIKTKQISAVTVKITELLNGSELNRAGHTKRIYDSVEHVVRTAYEAGYNLDDPDVQAALKTVVIAYASAAFNSDSGERDQSEKLVPGLYTDLDTLKKK